VRERVCVPELGNTNGLAACGPVREKMWAFSWTRGGNWTEGDVLTRWAGPALLGKEEGRATWGARRPSHCWASVYLCPWAKNDPRWHHTEMLYIFRKFFLWYLPTLEIDECNIIRCDLTSQQPSA